jgi:nucleotide-binding universal stress UspA family protein
VFRKIVLAVDGSEPSNRAVSVAGDLAGELGSEVVVVHVHEAEMLHQGSVEFGASEYGAQLVDATVRELKDSGVNSRGEVLTAIYGRAARVILELTDHEGADAVVMGSRGLSDLAGLVLGSVTHKVLHLAHCPVIVVR